MSQHCDPQDGMREAKLIQEATDGADSVADDLSDWLENLDRDCKDKNIPEIIQGNDGNHVFESLESLHTNFDTLFKQADISPARSSPRKKRITHRMFPIAAVICIIVLCMATAQAFGVNVFGAIAQWTSEQFHFSEGTTIPVTIGKSPLKDREHKTYKSLQDALNESNISGQLAPTWTPKRFTLKRVEARRVHEITIFSADYVTSDKQFISITLQEKSGENLVETEKNASAVELYKTHNTKYYLISDKTCEKATWSNGPIECKIYGNVSRKELKEIINSIYERK